ncbi:hypothetical protein GJV85_01260 [Sulfurimonas aquatica]|uniref:Lipoprotein n=1 Tax=Sulfurimonas aquatica TaxID=2672570 RepID=A0A975AY86_9BACT|nr:hypothetical protein [Sulfurimonas aquatica]QSZ40797.1 hypothetical protein GJV85_01260 [Sulfurimonas aquatica]
MRLFLISGMLSIFFFSGCAYKIVGLTSEEVKLHSIVMVAESEILCSLSGSDFIVNKGDIFGVEKIEGKKYVQYDMKTFSILDDDYMIFPKETLYMKLSNEDPIGFVVYPNGEFVYGYYNVARYTNPSDPFLLLGGYDCKYSGNKLFNMIINK